MASTRLNIEEKVSSFLNDRHNFIALLIVAFTLILRFNYAFMSGLWADEGRYANIGRALLDHPLDYSSRMDGTIKIFPPFLPYMLFISQAIFGAGDFAVRIVNPILGAMAVFLIYALGRMMFGKNTGLIAAALLSVSPIAWFYDERILLETPANFFAILTMAAFYYGFEHKNNTALYASGAFAILGFLSKQTAIFVVPAIALYLVASKKFAWLKERRIWIVALVAILVMLPWSIRSYNVCGKISCEGGQSVASMLTRAGLDIDIIEDPYYYVKLTPYLLTTPVLILFFFGLIPAINGKYRKEYVLLLSVSAITYLFTAFFAVKDLRYALLAVPPMLLIAANGIGEISRQLAGKEAKYAFLILLLILVPTLYGSYTAGKELILNKAPGFLMLKDGGAYFEKMPADTIIMGTSSQVISFYGGDKKMVGIPPKPELFDESMYNESVNYVELDVYERTLPKWAWEYIPNRPYITLEKVFYQEGQPVIGIFKVDRENLLVTLANKTAA